MKGDTNEKIMKDNYYSLQNTNRLKSRYKSTTSNYSIPKQTKQKQKTRQKNYKKQQANLRKRQARKLNYKKVAIFLIIVLLLFYLLISGIIKLFKNNDEQPVSAPIEVKKDITINMAVVGDIMCHTTNFYDAYDKTTDTYDFSKVFVDIKNYIQSADIAIGNLETTFAGKDIGYTGYPTFNTPEQLAQNLADLGLDVVSTANNHSLDKRYSGLVSTLDELDKVGLSHTGTYRSKEEQDTILIKDINGIKFAFLSFTYGTNGIPVPSGKEYCVNLIDETLILDQISKAQALNPDVICVNIHWGDEYKVKQNSSQEKLADLLFKNGVDIILGSHPHVLEPMEKRTVTLDDGTTKDGFVIYSLGNFMSGQVIENTRNSIILNLQITKHSDDKITIDSYDYIPTYMLDKGNGQTERYRILDIEKCILDYENGDTSISESLYNTLKKSKEKIDSIFVVKENV